MYNLGVAKVDVILLLYRSCLPSQVKLYWHDSVGNTEFSFIERYRVHNFEQERFYCIYVIIIMFAFDYSLSASACI